MAGISSATWTVIILTSDAELHRMYRMCPDTQLSHVMQIWRDDCRLFGNWSFLSFDEAIEYEIDCMTLQMVGEVYPDAAAVTLRAKLSKETQVKNIYIFLGGKCNHITVAPQQRMREVLWPLAKRPLSFKYEGVSLDPNKTIKQLELKNNSVVYESSCNVQVKLSSDETRTIEMDADGLVSQLIDRVSFHETKDEFSLMHCGRPLELNESVKDLKNVVEVARVEFTVIFKYRRVSFPARSQSVTFSAFLSRLSNKAQVDRQSLEEMKFYCTGCQRCVCKAATDDYEQILPIDCCKTKSLTLMAKPPSDTNAQSEYETRIKFIHKLYSDLLSNAATQPSRDDYRKMKNEFAESGIDTKEIAKWIKELQKIINGLKSKINSLEEEKTKFEEELTARNEDLKVQRTKIVELEANIKSHLEEIRTNMKKFHEEFKTNNDTMKARYTALETNIKREEEEFEVHMKNHFQDLGKNMTNMKKDQEDLEVYMRNRFEELGTNMKSIVDFHNIGPGVRLLVLYPGVSFIPVDDRPELQSRGQYNAELQFIRCEIEELRPGWATFEEVKKVLRPLFKGSEIVKIHQWHSSVGGRTVVWVTTTSDNETPTGLHYLCGLDGREFKGGDVQRDSQYIHEGGRVLIAGCRRRTIMQIRPS